MARSSSNSATNARLKTLEEAINRLETLIHSEISDLKGEQLTKIEQLVREQKNDTKEALERVETNTKEALARLSDDQRRLWDAVRSLENTRNETSGRLKLLHVIWIAVGGGFMGIVGHLISDLFSMFKSPHP